MQKKKKLIIAVALVVWTLVAIYLAFRTIDDLRSGKPSGVDNSLSLKHIIFPSLKMRDQE